MSAVYLKQGDTLPVQRFTIVDPHTGQVVDLTGASVHFHMGNFTKGAVVNSVATIVNAIAGLVSYSWIAADTAIIGTFSTEWQVLYPGGTSQTFPTDSYETVVVYSDLSKGLTVPL